MSGFGVVLIGVLVVGVFVAVILRQLVFDEARIEGRLHEAHTLEYDVPVGADPAVARTALMHAGFESVSELRAGSYVLLIGCLSAADRAEALKVLEGVFGTVDSKRTHVVG